MKTNTNNTCPQCGAPLPPDAPAGLCPACLMAMNLATPTIINEDGSAEYIKLKAPALEEIIPLFPQLEIIELLGKGGMGVVYKARQTKLDRVVALKILPKEIGGTAGFEERFAREARALGKLNHPNIVTLFEFGHVDMENGEPLYYFLMEYVDGLNLRQLLNNGRIEAREALSIVPQICDALQYAHDEGIVHRDIKPENILLDRRGNVKVADFGLAKIVGAKEEIPDASVAPSIGNQQSTIGNVIMGTPKYMSPEQVEAPGEVDHRADIYALGVVFYQMLTGEMPEDKLLPPSKKVNIDVRLDEVVLRALEQKPDLRYQQASILKTEVETIVADTPEGKGGTRHGERGEPSPSAGGTFSPWETTLITGGTVFFICYLFVVGGLNFPLREALIVMGGGGLIICALSIAGIWPFPSPIFPEPNFSSRNLRRNKGPKAKPAASEPRFSRMAIWGAVWAPLACIYLGFLYPIHLGTIGKPELVWERLIIVVVIAGLVAPLGTTILGWIAVSKIRHSAGRIYGLGLAVFDGLLFPLLALDALLGWWIFLLIEGLARYQHPSGGAAHPKGVQLISIPVLIAVDYLIIRRVWRAVKTPRADGGKTAEENAPVTARAKPGLEKFPLLSLIISELFFIGFLLPLLLGLLRISIRPDALESLIVLGFLGFLNVYASKKAVHQTQRLILKTAAVVSLVTWIAALSFSLFYFNAMANETGGWNPAPDEAYFVITAILGSILLPFCAWRMFAALRRGNGEEENPNKRIRIRSRRFLLTWIVPLVFAVGVLAAWLIFSQGTNRIDRIMVANMGAEPVEVKSGISEYKVKIGRYGKVYFERGSEIRIGHARISVGHRVKVVNSGTERLDIRHLDSRGDMTGVLSLGEKGTGYFRAADMISIGDVWIQIEKKNAPSSVMKTGAGIGNEPMAGAPLDAPAQGYLPERVVDLTCEEGIAWSFLDLDTGRIVKSAGFETKSIGEIDSWMRENGMEIRQQATGKYPNLKYGVMTTVANTSVDGNAAFDTVSANRTFHAANGIYRLYEEGEITDAHHWSVEADEVVVIKTYAGSRIVLERMNNEQGRALLRYKRVDTSFKPLPNAGPKPGRFIFLLPAAVVISAVVSIVLLVIHLRRRKGAVFSNTLAWKTITVTTVLIAAGVAVQQARVSRRRQAEKISEQRSYVRRAIIQKTQEKLWTLGYYPAYSKTTVADDLSKVWYEAGPVTKHIDGAEPEVITNAVLVYHYLGASRWYVQGQGPLADVGFRFHVMTEMRSGPLSVPPPPPTLLFDEIALPYPRFGIPVEMNGQNIFFPYPLLLAEAILSSDDYEPLEHYSGTNMLGYGYVCTPEIGTDPPYETVGLAGVAITRPDGTTLADVTDHDPEWHNAEITVYDETGRNPTAILRFERSSRKDRFMPVTPAEEAFTDPSTVNPDYIKALGIYKQAMEVWIDAAVAVEDEGDAAAAREYMTDYVALIRQYNVIVKGSDMEWPSVIMRSIDRYNEAVQSGDLTRAKLMLEVPPEHDSEFDEELLKTRAREQIRKEMNSNMPVTPADETFADPSTVEPDYVKALGIYDKAMEIWINAVVAVEDKGDAAAARKYMTDYVALMRQYNVLVKGSDMEFPPVIMRSIDRYNEAVQSGDLTRAELMLEVPPEHDFGFDEELLKTRAREQIRKEMNSN